MVLVHMDLVMLHLLHISLPLFVVFVTTKENYLTIVYFYWDDKFIGTCDCVRRHKF